MGPHKQGNPMQTPVSAPCAGNCFLDPHLGGKATKAVNATGEVLSAPHSRLARKLFFLPVLKVVELVVHGISSDVTIHMNYQIQNDNKPRIAPPHFFDFLPSHHFNHFRGLPKKEMCNM